VGRLTAARWDAIAPAALIGFCTLWRLPAIGDPPWLNDEGTYANLGMAIFKGEAIYRQIWENKPPAIYLLFGIVHEVVGPSGLLVGVRLLAAVAALIIQIAILRLTRPFAGRLVSMLAVAVAGLCLDLPILDGTSANAEIFMTACTTVGMALLWSTLRRVYVTSAQDLPAPLAPGVMVCAGAAFGAATMFKFVSGTDLLAALATVLVYGHRRGICMLALLFGTSLPVGTVAIWLTYRGLLGDALYATIGYNSGYVATGQGMHAPLFGIALLLIPALLIGIGVVLAQMSRQGGRSATPPGRGITGGGEQGHIDKRFAGAMSWWCGAALIGALASGRLYPHYFIEAVPPTAVCVALFARKALGGNERQMRMALAALIVTWSAGVPAGSWWASIGQRDNDARPYAYYAAAWLHLTGRIGDTVFGNRIDPRVERNVAVAQYLKAQPVRDRRLYVWGNTPWIYYLSGFDHAARFISAYYNPPIPGGMSQAIASLQSAPPSFIVVIEPALPESARLQTWLASRYRPVWSTENAVVYRLR
jgi:hypothetical protein